MNIEITGRHGAINDGLRDHARDRLEQAIRHVGGIVSAHVILDAEKTRQMAEMVVHGSSITATVHAESEDPYLSIDRAADKLRHQLEKHHGKRKARRRRGPTQEARTEAELAALEQGLAEPESPAPAEEDSLERRTVAPPALDLAAARGELAASVDGVVVFRSPDSGAVQVLYERGDGSCVLVDASGTA